MYRDPVPSLEAPSLQSPTAAMRPLGAGTFRVLARNQALIAGRAGRDIKLVVVCARSLARAMRVVGKDVALTNDPMQVATHPDVDVLVEAAGGTGPARDWVLAAIRAGKHVVTANKALLATHGNEIFAAARQHGVAVAYEGAVAVSIFVNRRVFMPMFRWLFEYSRDNFERQRRMNEVLAACVQELTIETVRLRQEVRRLSGQ